MTLLVRDEVDVIDAFIRYHSQSGIDALIVTDNGSRDGTREILEYHRRAGAVTEIIDEPSHIFEQPRFVDRMIRRARDFHAADYCINSDADEFWFPLFGSLRKELGRTCASRIYCRSFHMLPAAGQMFWESADRCVGRANPSKFGTSTYWNLFDKPTHKVIHRALGYKMIEAGNHRAEMDTDLPLYCSLLKQIRSSFSYRYSLQSKTIRIYHYSLRSVEQFKKKIIQGGAAIEASRTALGHQGSHWRRIYRDHMKNTLDLETEFYKITALGWIDNLRAAGVVISDHTMKDRLGTVLRVKCLGTAGGTCRAPR